MKKLITMLVVAALAIPLMAQEGQEGQQPAPERKNKELPPPEEHGRPELTAEQHEEFKENRLQLMENALKEIGVTAEQREQILILQEEHLEKMKANWKRMGQARRELSRLQDNGATEEELDAAIQEISEAQTEQLKTLVRNRMEMERILGKEKNKRFMEIARKQFGRQGRPPGPGVPPRPDTPPMPGERGTVQPPPIPPSNASE